MALAIRKREMKRPQRRKRTVPKNKSGLQRGSVLPFWKPLDAEEAISQMNSDSNSGPIGVTCSLEFSDPSFASALKYFLQQITRQMKQAHMRNRRRERRENNENNYENNYENDEISEEYEGIIQPAVRIYLAEREPSFSRDSPLFIRMSIQNDGNTDDITNLNNNNENNIDNNNNNNVENKQLDHISLSSKDARMLLDEGMAGRVHALIRQTQADVCYIYINKYKYKYKYK